MRNIVHVASTFRLDTHEYTEVRRQTSDLWEWEHSTSQLRKLGVLYYRSLETQNKLRDYPEKTCFHLFLSHKHRTDSNYNSIIAKSTIEYQFGSSGVKREGHCTINNPLCFSLEASSLSLSFWIFLTSFERC